MDNRLLNPIFSTRATLREGWKLVRGTKLAVLATIFPMLLVALIAFMVFTQLLVSNPTNNPYISLFFTFLTPLVDAILLSGFIGGLAMIGLKRARQQAVAYSDGLKYFKKLPKLAAITYLETLSIVIINNLILFATAFILIKLTRNAHLASTITLIIVLIVGLSLKTCFVFSFQFALDKQLSVLPAIGHSIKTVSQHFWKLLALVVILMLTNFIGASLAGVGLFWTLPFSYNSIGVAYRKLIDQAA